MPDIISINNTRIGLGEHKSISFNIARLPTYTQIDLPVHVYRSAIDGPVLLLTGGLHGDEINGTEIIRRMVRKGLVIPDKGTVIAIPIVNIYGFIQNERGLPDGKDINRSFPGSKNGSLAKLLAYTLMKEIIPHIDCGIDYHTGGASRANYPQVRVDFGNTETLNLAKAFSAPVILNSGLIPKSFRSACQKKRKHLLVYETGESLRLDEQGIKEGIDSTLRLMHYLGMISTKTETNSPRIFEKSTWIRSKRAGLFHSKVVLGEELNKKQLLGTVNDPYGDNETKILSTKNGMVIGLNNCPVVNKGDALIHFAFN